ncbi:MAG: TraR/DksA C4-type zinc finger protein, partial [Desulfobacterales bacterium]|nr:TraR/DksA C4-type zinc finger protein [Desulfobacterales bacterium]
KIQEMEKKIEAFTQLSKPVAPDNAIGRLTRMEALNSKGINEASLAGARDALRALEDALARVDDPDFGYCRHCEEPIAPKRLRIMPETPFCTACAQKLQGG